MMNSRTVCFASIIMRHEHEHDAYPTAETGHLRSPPTLWRRRARARGIVSRRQAPAPHLALPWSPMSRKAPNRTRGRATPGRNATLALRETAELRRRCLGTALERGGG